MPQSLTRTATTRLTRAPIVYAFAFLLLLTAIAVPLLTTVETTGEDLEAESDQLRTQFDDQKWYETGSWPALILSAMLMPLVALSVVAIGRWREFHENHL